MDEHSTPGPKWHFELLLATRTILLAGAAFWSALAAEREMNREKRVLIAFALPPLCALGLFLGLAVGWAFRG